MGAAVVLGSPQTWPAGIPVPAGCSAPPTSRGVGQLGAAPARLAARRPRHRARGEVAGKVKPPKGPRPALENRASRSRPDKAWGPRWEGSRWPHAQGTEKEVVE